MTWRRFGVLLRQLPPESRTARRQNGTPDPVTITDRLLAATVNHLAAANWQRSGGKSAKPKPVIFPAPPKQGVGPAMTKAELSDRAAAWTERNAAKLERGEA